MEIKRNGFYMFLRKEINKKHFTFGFNHTNLACFNHTGETTQVQDRGFTPAGGSRTPSSSFRPDREPRHELSTRSIVLGLGGRRKRSVFKTTFDFRVAGQDLSNQKKMERRKSMQNSINHSISLHEMRASPN